MAEAETFAAMFKKATGHPPFPYQTALATAPQMPSLLDVPTGLGKTAGAILAWLYRRRFAPAATRRSTPRRLVYCLPMRTLVEQTRDCALRWLQALDLLEGTATFADNSGPRTKYQLPPD